MKKLLLASLLLASTALSYATELNYQWKSGSSYHFSAVVTDDVNTSMMGMTMTEQFKTTTDFVLFIQSVDGSGTASGMLYLVNFNVVDSKGTQIASIKDVPQKAIKSDIKVDKKGNFTFLKKVYLITSGTSNVLAYGSADANSASVGGQAGNMKVDAYAEFDPKTGSLKTGYKVQEIKNTTSVEVKVTEETDQIDVLPYDFLQFLILPEGSVNLNDEVKAQAGIYKMVVKATDMSGGIATLNHQMATDKSAGMFDGGASGTSGDGSSTFDMNMDTDLDEGGTSTSSDFDMGDMGMDMNMDMDMDMGSDMGMDTEDQAAMDMSKGMAPDMQCNITSKFDYQNGMFSRVFGTVTTDMNTMGMKMNVVSKLEMVLNK